MNRIHRWLYRSNRWRKKIEPRMSWVLNGLELGPEVLEVGPGPGLTTDRLRRDARRITVIEIDPALAESLRSRMRGSNVTEEIMQQDRESSGAKLQEFKDMETRCSRCVGLWGFGLLALGSFLQMAASLLLH